MSRRASASGYFSDPSFLPSGSTIDPDYNEPEWWRRLENTPGMPAYDGIVIRQSRQIVMISNEGNSINERSVMSEINSYDSITPSVNYSQRRNNIFNTARQRTDNIGTIRSNTGLVRTDLIDDPNWTYQSLPESEGGQSGIQKHSKQSFFKRNTRKPDKENLWRNSIVDRRNLYANALTINDTEHFKPDNDMDMSIHVPQPKKSLFRSKNEPRKTLYTAGISYGQSQPLVDNSNISEERTPPKKSLFFKTNPQKQSLYTAAVSYDNNDVNTSYPSLRGSQLPPETFQSIEQRSPPKLSLFKANNAQKKSIYAAAISHNENELNPPEDLDVTPRITSPVSEIGAQSVDENMEFSQTSIGQDSITYDQFRKLSIGAKSSPKFFNASRRTSNAPRMSNLATVDERLSDENGPVLSQSLIDREFIEELQAKRTNPPVRHSTVFALPMMDNSLEIDDEPPIKLSYPIRHSNVPIGIHNVMPDDLDNTLVNENQPDADQTIQNNEPELNIEIQTNKLIDDIAIEPNDASIIARMILEEENTFINAGKSIKNLVDQAKNESIIPDAEKPDEIQTEKETSDLNPQIDLHINPESEKLIVQIDDNNEQPEIINEQIEAVEVNEEQAFDNFIPNASEINMEQIDDNNGQPEFINEQINALEANEEQTLDNLIPNASEMNMEQIDDNNRQPEIINEQIDAVEVNDNNKQPEIINEQTETEKIDVVVVHEERGLDNLITNTSEMNIEQIDGELEVIIDTDVESHEKSINSVEQNRKSSIGSLLPEKLVDIRDNSKNNVVEDVISNVPEMIIEFGKIGDVSMQTKQSAITTDVQDRIETYVEDQVVAEAQIQDIENTDMETEDNASSNVHQLSVSNIQLKDILHHQSEHDESNRFKGMRMSTFVKDLAGNGDNVSNAESNMVLEYHSENEPRENIGNVTSHTYEDMELTFTEDSIRASQINTFNQPSAILTSTRNPGFNVTDLLEGSRFDQKSSDELLKRFRGISWFMKTPMKQLRQNQTEESIDRTRQSANVTEPDETQQIRDFTSADDQERKKRLDELMYCIFDKRKEFVEKFRKDTSVKPSNHTIQRKRIQNPRTQISDENIKVPKLYMKEPWITKRLYSFVQQRINAKYGIKTIKRSEKFVKDLADIVNEVIENEEDKYDYVVVLKNEMARLKLVETHYDFDQFVRDYLPCLFRLKAIPGLDRKVPNLTESVFEPIRKKQKS